MAVKDSVQNLPKMGFNMLQSCPHAATLDTNYIYTYTQPGWLAGLLLNEKKACRCYVGDEKKYLYLYY